jgi:hypothetical protein
VHIPARLAARFGGLHAARFGGLLVPRLLQASGGFSRLQRICQFRCRLSPLRSHLPQVRPRC